MKNVFLNAYKEYVNHMRTVIEDYDNHTGHEGRRLQCHSVIEVINEDFNFDKIIVLETGGSWNYNDGLFGLFLGFLAKQTGGKMISVDISEDVVVKSRQVFKKVIPDLNYTISNDDSISFINHMEDVPNIVHLDSWDFNLFDILPSALHGWEEFKAIESRMPKGGIIIIDDNYPKNTNMQFVYNDGRVKKTVVDYPMIGKGAHVYQYVLRNDTQWRLLGTHYDSADNIKIIIQKK